MKTVVVEGKRYKVLENLGFQHGRGCWAAEVETSDGPMIATRGSMKGAPWVWASPAPIQPKSKITGQ